MRRDALARDQAAVHINRTIENAYNSGGSKSDVRLHAMEAMRESGAEPSTDTLDLVLKTLFPR